MADSTLRAKINPELLIWARSTAGYTINDIAHSVGVDPAQVVKWEDGELLPTFKQLQDFANKVKRPVAALFLPYKPIDPTPPKDYRIVRGTRSRKLHPDTLLAIRKVRNAIDTVVELTIDAGKPLRMDIPHIQQKTPPEEAAKLVRGWLGVSVAEQLHWKDDRFALQGWRDALFESGVLTFQFSFPRSDARGFTITQRDLGAIAVSAGDARVARIFSLFHECCHLCLGKPGISGQSVADEEKLKRAKSVFEMERYCDKFAAAFLLPLDDKEVMDKLKELAQGELDDKSISRIARKFKVSREVLLLRLEAAALVGAETVSEFLKRWRAQPRKKTGGFATPDLTCLNHFGRGYVGLVLEAMDSGRMSEVDASHCLDNIKPKWFDDVKVGLFTGGVHE